MVGRWRGGWVGGGVGWVGGGGWVGEWNSLPLLCCVVRC